MLNKSPDDITVGEIVKLLEGGINLSNCIADPEICERHSSCLTRSVWKEATEAMYEKLNSITLSEMIDRAHGNGEFDMGEN